MQIMNRQFLLAFVTGVFTCFPLCGQDRTRAWERKQSLDDSRSFSVSVQKVSDSYQFYHSIAKGGYWHSKFGLP